MHAMTFNALGEPSRLRIVELLRTGPLSVGAIAEALSIRQPQVSKHLKVLNDAGLVIVQPVARHRVYELQTEPFVEIASWVESFDSLWQTRLDSLGTFLATMADPATPNPSQEAEQ